MDGTQPELNTTITAQKPGPHADTTLQLARTRVVIKVWTRLAACDSDPPIADHGYVNTVRAVEVFRGRDGKLYPAVRASQAELDRIVDLEHNLVHRDHCSVRQAQAIMRDSYAVRRSVGSIMRDLSLFTCDACDHGDQP